MLSRGLTVGPVHMMMRRLYERNGLPAPNTPQVMQELERWLAKQQPIQKGTTL